MAGPAPRGPPFPPWTPPSSPPTNSVRLPNSPYPSPHQGTGTLLVVFFLVVAIVLPVMLAMAVYVYETAPVSRGPDRIPKEHPIMFRLPVDHAGGNATITIASVAASVRQADLRFMLGVDEWSFVGPLPPADGSVSVSMAGSTFHISWFDRSQRDLVSAGDEFVVTGDLAPLPAATEFVFWLFPVDRSWGIGAGWRTI